MRKRGSYGGRFERDEGVNPMNYISNLSDIMLVLAVGIMLALVVRWNVDISPSGSGTTSGSPADTQGSVAVDPDKADASFTEEELEEMRGEAEQNGGGLEKRGVLYYDAATGKYYIIESGNDGE